MTPIDPNAPIPVDEKVLQAIFDPKNKEALTTKANLLFLKDAAKEAPTLFIWNDISLNFGGTSRVYEGGTWVYLNSNSDGVSALEARSFSNAIPGPSVDGRMGVGAWTSRSEPKNWGNVAQLLFGPDSGPSGAKMLLTMPGESGPAFSFPYNVDNTADTVAKIAARTGGNSLTSQVLEPQASLEAPKLAPLEIPQSPAPVVENPKPLLPKVLHGAGRYLLGLPTAIEGADAFYEEWNKSHKLIESCEAGATGAAHGAVDTLLPGATSGYSDVIGGGDLTYVDRLLNFANDATGTATTIGATAMAAETAGVITIPAEIPTALGVGVAAVGNLGVNVAKGLLKVTGLSGDDQDGGYIYDGISWAASTVESWFGGDTSSDADNDKVSDAKRGGMTLDAIAETALRASAQMQNSHNDYRASDRQSLNEGSLTQSGKTMRSFD